MTKPENMKHTQNRPDSDDDIAQSLGIGASARTGRRLKKWLIGTLLVLLAAFVAFKFSAKENAPSFTYKTEAVQQGSLTITVSATGNLEPTNQVDVGSELSGIIKTVEVDYNDHVKAGQILARLDTTKLKATVRQSEAALAAAKAEVLNARATVKESQNELERLKAVRRLSNNKAVSQHDLDAAEAALERGQAAEASAKADVLKSKAALESNKTDLTKALIRSPINGIILSREVEPGQTVAASLEAPVLFTVAEDLTKMELHVDVDEADVSQVKEGQQASFTVDAYPERTFPATISQVRFGAEEEDGVVTYETVLSVENADLLLRPGMTATADIITHKIEQAILVPNGALRFSPPQTGPSKAPAQPGNSGGFLSKLLPRPPRHKSAPKENLSKNGSKKEQLVWSLNDGHLVPVPVTIGVSDGLMSEVTSGNVQPGMKLVVDTVSVGKGK